MEKLRIKQWFSVALNAKKKKNIAFLAITTAEAEWVAAARKSKGLNGSYLLDQQDVDYTQDTTYTNVRLAGVHI